MEKPVVVDKFTYKIMKYIYRHNGVSLDTINKKFGKDSFLSIVHIVGAHLACVREDEKYTYQVKDHHSVIYLTINGNAYVESRRSTSSYQIITVVVSLLALCASVLAIFLK